MAAGRGGAGDGRNRAPADGADAGDEVDAIVAAWQRERPDLDVEPLHVLSRLDRLAGVLGLRRIEIFARHDLRPHEFDVLAALRRAGSPFRLTAGDLAAQTHVTSGTMTSRVDGLARRGLVTRVPDSDDGRLVRVELTDEGAAIVEDAFEELLGVERDLLTPIAAESLEPLAQTLRALLASASTSSRAPSASRPSAARPPAPRASSEPADRMVP